ncbi:MAG TPA: iron ABC transporter permease [Chromatiales bacterium]|nr:iron ABC transporter permease [Chromatiales bacterium]
MNRSTRVLVGLLLFSLLSLGLALALGSGSPSDSALLRQIVLELRLPRALSAFAIGGLLALAGVLMQVLLRNPLGDPYILGVSGGAATAALLGMLLGAGGLMLSLGAFGGAMLAMFMVFALSHGDGPASPTRLLLTGVVLAAGWGALISFLLAISPSPRLPGMLFWLMGDLSDADAPLLPALALVAGGGVAWLLARPLNLLLQGADQAALLGVETDRLQWGVFLLASLLTAVAVTAGGSIGFVGLVVPHLYRLLDGSDHRRLIPGAILLGGGLLVVTDTLSRTLLAPRQLPVGVVTALVGVPLFLWLLRRQAPA